jgi:hypothetical protein
MTKTQMMEEIDELRRTNARLHATCMADRLTLRMLIASGKLDEELVEAMSLEIKNARGHKEIPPLSVWRNLK